jgi:hypothetical protein
VFSCRPGSSVPKAQSYDSPGWSDGRETNVAQLWDWVWPKPKSPNGAALIRALPSSIPNVLFINFDSMSLAHLPEFVLE